MSRKESLDGTAESGNNGGGGGGGEIMLFGVRVKVDPMRKSVSMNNLSQYEQPNGNNTNTTNEAVVVAEDTGCASADDTVLHQSTGGRERKRGVPWTEEEHKLFLLGLQKVGKGDWRGISRNFVKTRTPTQVASHAQKYFLRKNNLNRRRRRRSSLFDITTDSVTAMPMEESKCQLENSNQQVLLPTSLPIPETARVTSNTSAYSVVPFPVTVGPVLLPMQVQNPMEILTLGKVNQVNNASTMILHPVPVVPIPVSSAMVDLNLNQRLAVEPAQLSLGLSLSSNQSQSSTRRSAFQVMSRFSNGDGIITVA